MTWQLINATRGTDLTDFARPISAVRYTHNAYADTSRLNFRLEDDAGTLVIEPEDELFLRHDGVKVFGGFVRQRERTDAGTSAQRIIAIGSQDYTTLLSDDPVDTPTILPAGQSDKQWITTVFTAFGTRGIVLGSLVQQLRASMPADLDVTGLTLHQVLTEIAKVTGGSFYVDHDKRLHYFTSEVEAAPFNLSDAPNGTTTFGYEAFGLPDDSVEWRNAVFVKGEGIALWRYRGGVPPAPGTRRAAVINDPEITTVEAAEARGDAFLDGAGDFRQAGSLITHKPGLRAGMTIQITHSGWGIAAETYRITQVDAQPITPDRVQYVIRFGGRPVNLADFFGSTSQAVSEVARRQPDVARIVADLSVGGANMVPNSSFEDGTTWSVGSQWAIGIASADPFFGAKVARVQPVGTATGELSTPLIAVARSDHWWASAWSKVIARTSGVTEMRVHEYGPGNTLLVTHVLPVSAVESEWTRRAIHFAPAPDIGITVWNPSTTHVRIAFAATTNPVLTWEVDGVQLERGQLLTAYAPAPSELVEGSITGGKLADLAITATKIADNAIETPKLAANSIVASKIAAAQVTTDKIATNAVVAGKIAASAITADKIAAAAVTADKIAAGAITAEKMLLIGARTPLIDNPDFESGLSGWRAQPAAGGIVEHLTTAAAASGAGVVRIKNGATIGSKVEPLGLFSVAPGETIHVTASVRANAAVPPGKIRAWLVVLNADKTSTAIFGPLFETPALGATGTWSKFTGKTSVPTGRAWARVMFENTVVNSDMLLDNVIITRTGVHVGADGDVVSDDAGLTILDGRIIVRNATGTVVIDGSSNMFKIILAGSATIPSFAGPGQVEVLVTHFTGVPYRPAHMVYYLDETGVDETILLPLTYFDSSTGLVTRSHWASVVVGNPNETKVRLLTRARTTVEQAQRMKYFLFREEAI